MDGLTVAELHWVAGGVYLIAVGPFLLTYLLWLAYDGRTHGHGQDREDARDPGPDPSARDDADDPGPTRSVIALYHAGLIAAADVGPLLATRLAAAHAPAVHTLRNAAGAIVAVSVGGPGPGTSVSPKGKADPPPVVETLEPLQAWKVATLLQTPDGWRFTGSNGEPYGVEAVAMCPNGCGGRVPNLSCGCGFYAVKDPAQLPSNGNVHLQVELYGRVHEGERGIYRAEKQRVLSAVPKTMFFGFHCRFCNGAARFATNVTMPDSDYVHEVALCARCAAVSRVRFHEHDPLDVLRRDLPTDWRSLSSFGAVDETRLSDRVFGTGLHPLTKGTPPYQSTYPGWSS